MPGPRKNLTPLDMKMLGLAYNQGGIINFLGKQPEVTAPVRAQSHADSPPTQLAYITDAEKDLLVNANIHGSMDGKPNPGPAGLPSLDDFYTTTDEKGNVKIGGGGGEQVFSYEQGDQQGAGGYTPQTGVGSSQGVTDEGKIVESKKPTSPEEAKPEPEEKKTKDKESKIKSFKDWFDENIFGQPIGSGNLVTQAALEKLKEFKELDVGLFKSFMLNRGNALAGLFGDDQTYSDMEGNIIDPKSVSEGPEGMKGLNEDGEIVDVRYTKEGFNDLMKDTFGKGIFETLKKEYPEEYYPYAGTPQTSGGLADLASIDATKFGSRTLPDGSPNPNYNPDFANQIFAARAELDRMGKDQFGNTQQVAAVLGIPGIPSLPVPRPGPIPPDSYPIPGPIPFPLPYPTRPPYGNKFQTPYNYYAQSPQYTMRGLPTLNTNEFNENLRRYYG